MSYTGIQMRRESETTWTDTLEEWGLILLDDLTIDEAKLKETWVDVPGANGALNLSYVMTDGEPVYEMRNISFTLFCSGLGRSGGALTHGTPPDEQAVNLIRAQLQGRYHGRIIEIILPDDPTHFFRGVLSVGAKSKFNSGRIPITIKAYPFRLNNTLIEVEMAPGTRYELTNSGSMRITPDVHVIFPEVDPPYNIGIYKISPEPLQGWDIYSRNGLDQNRKLEGLYLYPGTTTLSRGPLFETTRVIVSYREGRL